MKTSHGSSVAAAPVGDDVGEVGGRVPGRRERAHDGVAELDRSRRRRSATWSNSTPGARREVGDRAGRLDERGQPGDVVGLHVRLEDRHDRRADPLGLAEVVVDELDVRVDDREPRRELAAEQVARAGGRLVEERAQDHRSEDHATARTLPSS